MYRTHGEPLTHFRNALFRPIFVSFLDLLRSQRLHLIQEIISINHSSLATLHLTTRKLNHAVRQVVEGIAWRAENLKNREELLEVKVLFITNHPNLLVGRKILNLVQR